MTSRERAEQVARDYGTEQGGWLTTRLAREFDEATQAAAAQMRERCADLVENHIPNDECDVEDCVCQEIAAAIRALPLTEEHNP